MNGDIKLKIYDIFHNFFSLRLKRSYELRYWKKRKKEEGVLINKHYKYFYTEHFKLNDQFYSNKIILDIGCGPRGSLEWASTSRLCIGLDPLACEYLSLGTNKHRMQYICSTSEKIPIQDAKCDVVFSFNSLDHVDNISQTIDEIKRVTKHGGLFLLLVEVNHSPTKCEPHHIAPMQVVKELGPDFICNSLDVYMPNGRGIYSSIRDNQRIPNPEQTNEMGYMSARFLRL